MEGKQQYEKATLRTIADGQAIGAFDFELGRAIESCLDVNTDPKAVRKVTLTVTVKPNFDRSQAELTYQAKASLPADAAGVEHLYLATTAEGPAAFVHTVKQLGFEDFEKEQQAEVTRLVAAGSAK